MESAEFEMHWELYHVIDSCFERTDSHHLISPHTPSTRHWTTEKSIMTSLMVTILPHVPSMRHWTTEKPIVTSQLSKLDPRVCCTYKYRGDESFLSLSFYIIIYDASRSLASTGSFNPSSVLSGSPFTVYSIKPFTKMLVTSPLTSDPSSCE